MSLSRNVPFGRRNGSAAGSVVALAASAGGLQAVSRVLADLPAHFHAAVLIVQHLDPRFPSFMAQILARRTHLRVVEARDGDVLRPGTAYVAPPDRHLTLEADGSILLSESARVKYVRPSADVTFASIARHFGPRATGVVLTGFGSDGSDGLQAIKRAGGTVIVQDALSAEFVGMPSSAIQTGAVDFILELEDIGHALMKVVEGSIG